MLHSPISIPNSAISTSEATVYTVLQNDLIYCFAKDTVARILILKNEGWYFTNLRNPVSY